MITELKLSQLPRKPNNQRCGEIDAAWRYLGSAHKSVSGLFDAFNVLRGVALERTGDARGRISNDLQDQLRAAIVFTSAGLDACLTRLLQDALPVLVQGNAQAEKKFKTWCHNRLTADRAIPKSMLPAILDRDPRARLIELYVTDIAKPSLQSTDDMTKIRDAFGITPEQLSDDQINQLEPFFAARNEIAHELDLIEASGPGNRKRRPRDIEAVRDQCEDVIQMVTTVIVAAAQNLRACDRPSAPVAG